MGKNIINLDHLTQLAKIVLTKKEKKSLIGQLEETVSHVKVLQELDTQTVPATSQVTGLENVYRQDKAKRELGQKEALANAPAQKESFFIVPRVKWQ